MSCIRIFVHLRTPLVHRSRTKDDEDFHEQDGWMTRYVHMFEVLRSSLQSRSLIKDYVCSANC